MMLAGALEDAMSGCKGRATDFSIAAIMSRGGAVANGIRHPSPPLQIGEWNNCQIIIWNDWSSFVLKFKPWLSSEDCNLSSI